MYYRNESMFTKYTVVVIYTHSICLSYVNHLVMNIIRASYIHWQEVQIFNRYICSTNYQSNTRFSYTKLLSEDYDQKIVDEKAT